MVLFVFAVLLFIGTLAATLVGRSYTKKLAKLNLEKAAAIDSKGRASSHLDSYINDAGIGVTVTTVAKWVTLGLGLVLLAFSIVRVVPANNVGIPVTFGSIGEPMGSGFHITAPWTKVHNFSTRLQESSMLSSGEGEKGKTDSISVRGSDGYEMFVDVTIRYTIEQDVANTLFRRVGSMDGVQDRIVRPEVRETVRIVFARFTAEEGYSAKREQIAADTNTLLAERLTPYGVNLDSAVIRSVDPEEKLKAAIGDRAAARERALQAEIEQKKLVTESETRKQVAERDATAAVTKSQGEADARRISAQGEADANNKISASLTQELIQKLYADALASGTVFVVPDGGNFILPFGSNPVTPTK